VAKLAPSTRRNHHIILRSVIRAVGPVGDEPGVMLGALPNFPPLPKVGKTEVDAVAPEDLQVLLGPRPKGAWRATWDRFQLAVALGYYAGLRASEIRALRRKDVDLENRAIVVRRKRCAGEEGAPKSKHQRSVDFIPDALFARLEARCRDLGPDDYVCPNPHTGEPYGDSALLQSFKRACKALGIKGQKLHGLRHAFATTLFAGNVDARTVQDLLGHSSLEVTMRYAHVTKERKRAAGAVFDTVPVEPDEVEPAAE
jgi:integrase